MEPEVNSFEFAKFLQATLIKGQTENQITVNELLEEIVNQLEALMKK